MLRADSSNSSAQEDTPWFLNDADEVDSTGASVHSGIGVIPGL